jgi:hypothetical protein
MGAVDGIPISRRGVLSTVAGTAAVGLAGCTGRTVDNGEGECSTSVVSGGDTGGAIQEARVRPIGGPGATLWVILNPDQASGVAAIDVTGSTDDYRIPLLDESPQRVYRQSLGTIPHNGRLQIRAVDQAGETLDAITVTFRCEDPSADDDTGFEPEET